MKGFSGPIEDRLAIRERIDSYNDAVFRNDAEDWAACWTQDAVWAVGGAEVGGREALVAHWRGLMAGFAAAAMYVNHAAMAIDGDTAECRCYMLEMLQKTDGGQLLVSGRYDDRLRREADGAWRFAERRYSVLQFRG